MKEDKKDKYSKQILFNSFNQDYKCFLIGTKEGITIYHSLPFQKAFELGKKKYYFKLNI